MRTTSRSCLECGAYAAVPARKNGIARSFGSLAAKEVGDSKDRSKVGALQNLLHRARDLPDALLNQSRRFADVSDRLTAIVENAKVP